MLFAGLFILGAVLFVGFFAFVVFTSGPKSITYNQLLDLIEHGQIARINIVGGGKVVGEVRNAEDPAFKDLELNSGKFTTVLPKSENLDPFIREII